MCTVDFRPHSFFGCVTPCYDVSWQGWTPMCYILNHCTLVCIHIAIKITPYGLVWSWLLKGHAPRCWCINIELFHRYPWIVTNLVSDAKHAQDATKVLILMFANTAIRSGHKVEESRAHSRENTYIRVPCSTGPVYRGVPKGNHCLSGHAHVWNRNVLSPQVCHYLCLGVVQQLHAHGCGVVPDGVRQGNAVLQFKDMSSLSDFDK